jgi:hypothetical protein
MYHHSNHILKLLRDAKFLQYMLRELLRVEITFFLNLGRAPQPRLNLRRGPFKRYPRRKHHPSLHHHVTHSEARTTDSAAETSAQRIS